MNMLMISTNIPWLDTLITKVFEILNPILILVAVAGIIYSIVVGVKFARADDKSARDEAKQKLITVIVGVVVTGILVALFYWLANSIGTTINPTEWI